MTTMLSPGIAVVIARGAFVVSLAALAWTLARAVRTAPDAMDGSAVIIRAPGDTTVAPRENADIARTIALAPFAMSRVPPSAPYRIERPKADAPATVVAAKPVALIGTVVSEISRSFAMCQLGGEAPRLVYPGQTIGAMTLDSVSQGSAVFTDNAGTRVVLRVSKAGSSK